MTKKYHKISVNLFFKSRALLCALMIICAPFAVMAQTAAQTAQNNIAGHSGNITAIVIDPEGRIITAGEDGYIHIWDRQKNAVDARLQASRFPIRAMILHPERPEIALVESNTNGLSRVSVWNYQKKESLFTLPFSDRISNVFYSAGGAFLMITGNRGMLRVNSETGEFMSVPQTLTGTVTFAATGRSERSMVAYSVSGALTYWDLENGNLTQAYNIPRNIQSPLMLGNNRFLAGFDSNGLLIVDAVTGHVMLRDNTIRSGVLFTGYRESMEFICLVPGNRETRQTSALHHIRLHTQPNRLEIVNRRTVASNMPIVNCGVIVADDLIALGTADGRVMTFNRLGITRLMTVNTRQQTAIEEIAATASVVAFKTKDSRLGYIPADFTLFNSRNTLWLTDAGSYSHIAAGYSESLASELPSNPSWKSDFLLWQSENTRSFPLIKHITGNPERGSLSETFIDKLTLRFALRSVSIYKNLYMFLDFIGNITIINQESGNVVFTYTTSGAQDAGFIDEGNILIGRSAGPCSSAFLMVNIRTGETVPLQLHASVGAKIYRGPSGALYGAAVSSTGNIYKTSLICIDTANPARSINLTEIETEDTNISITESGGYAASIMGAGEAKLFTITGNRAVESRLERSPGFPLQLANGGGRIISLDADGNICWHEPETGKILAVFRLYADNWILEYENNVIRGTVRRN